MISLTQDQVQKCRMTHHLTEQVNLLADDWEEMFNQVNSVKALAWVAWENHRDSVRLDHLYRALGLEVPDA